MDENFERRCKIMAGDFRAGCLGGFKTQLIKAYQIADPFNRGKLAAVFPEEWRAFEMWYHDLDQTVEERKEEREAK